MNMTPTETMTLRVLTLNVWNDTRHPERDAMLRDGMRALDPDLIALTGEWRQLTLRVVARELLDFLLRFVQMEKRHVGAQYW